MARTVNSRKNQPGYVKRDVPRHTPGKADHMMGSWQPQLPKLPDGAPRAGTGTLPNIDPALSLGFGKDHAAELEATVRGLLPEGFNPSFVHHDEVVDVTIAHTRPGGTYIERTIPFLKSDAPYEQDLADLQDWVASYLGHRVDAAQEDKTPTKQCTCAHFEDGSTNPMLCPEHAESDPCELMPQMSGRRRKGTIRAGTCTNCGWSAA